MCLERHNRRAEFIEKRPPQHSKMVTKAGKLIISLIFFGALYTADAAITAWSTPSITGADGTGTLDIAESQTTGETIQTIVATGGSGPTYTLAQAVSPFELATNGDLTITAALDHETTQTYTLLIVATDTDSATATATVTVSVTDVNEHDPMFSATSYSRCIVDASPADTTLTTVTATDEDTSDTIVYAIVPAGNTDSAFKINTGTGLIQVNDAKTLDKATLATYTLVVTAADTVGTVRTGTTTVSVTVADSCNSGTLVAVSMMMLIVSLFVALF